MIDPSSCLTSLPTFAAIKLIISSLIFNFSPFNFFLIMATFNSNSGGAISTCNPQQNLVLSLSSRNFKSSGYLSDDTIICLLSLCKLLKV